MWGTNQTSRRAVAAVITAGALALAGCTTGEPDDEITAPSFTPVSPEPSEPEAAPSPDEPSTEPTVAAPPLPPEATEQTPEGAVAFTEWWFDTLNYATETGDTEALRAASDPGCEFCDNLAQRSEDTYLSGGSIVGGLADVEVTQPGSIQDRGVNVSVFASLEQGSIVDASGEVQQEFSASPSRAVIATLLRSAQGGWVMGAVTE